MLIAWDAVPEMPEEIAAFYWNLVVMVSILFTQQL